MVELAELKRIAAQKRLIQAESDICRRSIQLELDGFKLDTAWVRRGIDWLNRYRTTLLLLAAPLGGALVTRRARGVRRLLLQGFAAWQLMRRAGAVGALLRRRPWRG
jgi:hypothetical protein